MKHGKIRKCSRWAVLLIVMLVPPALGAEVYRWTDENGVTHFSQTPPPSGQEAEIADVPETADEAAAEGAGIDFDGAQGDLDQGSDALSAAEQERRQIARRHDAVRAQQEEQQRLCNEARSRLARLEPNRRVYYTNEEGETVRMDDEERVAEVDELRSFLDQNCQ